MIPSIGNAVSSSEFTFAYMTPFIIGAIIIDPNIPCSDNNSKYTWCGWVVQTYSIWPTSSSAFGPWLPKTSEGSPYSAFITSADSEEVERFLSKYI